MKKMMDLNEILNLTKELMKINPGILDEFYLPHLSDSYKIAEEIIDKILFKYPLLKIKLNKKETVLAVELHDVGRFFKKEQLFHELRGAKYIEEHGLEKGIADNLVDVYRVAQMIRPHFLVAEQFADEANAKERAEFEPLDSRLLIPRTWQEAIVVYADLSNIRGKRMSINERIKDIKERYAFGSDFERSNPSLIKAMEKGLPRLLETCKEVEKLIAGKLSEEEIMRYGFI